VDEYVDIEQVYLNHPANLDKDRFCQVWIKEGGIQGVLDRREGQINQLMGNLKKKEQDAAQWLELYSEANDQCKRLEAKQAHREAKADQARRILFGW
jgi:hypothetical protein